MSYIKLYKPFYDENITPETKKYSVYVLNPKTGNPKLIHFGDSNMQHYFDKIGYWSDLNHMDKERRRLYRARASGIKNKAGKLTYKDKNTSNYWSYNYLW